MPITYSRSAKFKVALAALGLIFFGTLLRGPSRPVHYIQNKLGIRPSFYDIAFRYGTDKVTVHHYERVYERMLAPFRDKPIKMVEIGLGCNMAYGPGASYYTWLEYFPYVDLYYIEFDEKCALAWQNKTKQATIFTGDQADPEFLKEFLERTGGDFDIIIDDGGHTMKQQRVSLDILWDSVVPGGIYFIEDLATSYISRMGGGVGKDDTMMGDLKRMMDDMNKVPGEKDFTKQANGVRNFDFAQEIIALTKMGVDE